MQIAGRVPGRLVVAVVLLLGLMQGRNALASKVTLWITPSYTPPSGSLHVTVHVRGLPGRRPPAAYLARLEQLLL